MTRALSRNWIIARSLELMDANASSPGLGDNRLDRALRLFDRDVGLLGVGPHRRIAARFTL